MDCKVIYEFDHSLSKTFVVTFVGKKGRARGNCLVMVWIWDWFKATLCKGVIGDRFMFINYTIYTIHA